MVSEIFSTITEVITSFFGSLSQGVNSITGLIYTPGSGSDAGKLTTFGTLLLISAGVGIVYWLFRMVRKLVHAA